MSRLPEESHRHAVLREPVEVACCALDDEVMCPESEVYRAVHSAEEEEEHDGGCKKPMQDADASVIEVIDDDNEEEDEDKVLSRGRRFGKLRRWMTRLVPPGGVISSSFTLGSSTLGAGILGLPAAFNSMGLVTSLIMLMAITVLTIFSLWLLARCAEMTKMRTYEDVTRVLLGRGADFAAAIFMLGFCVGGGVSYIISIGDLLTPIFDDARVPAFLKTKPGNRLITSMIWLVCILPLCLPKNIDSLRHTSILGVIMVTFFVICIVQDSCVFMRKNGWREDVKLFNTGNSAIEGLGTVMFACLVQINAQEVYYAMAKPSPRNMVRNSTIAMSACGILYALAAVFGYARFGPTVKSPILLKYQPRDSPQFWVAYFGIVVKICVAFALHQLPVRDGIYHFFSWDVYQMLWWKNAVICGAIAAVTLIIGLFVPNINIVLGLVGSLCGGFIGFIFPALMIMYSGNWTLAKVGWLEWSATYFLLIVGIIAAVFGTSASIYSVL